jgi:hypothetical protein
MQAQEGPPAGSAGSAGGDWGGSSGGAAPVKEMAREWLDKGGKWLASAGRKVAAAAKEAGSSLQSRLDELEVFRAAGARVPLLIPI